MCIIYTTIEIDPAERTWNNKEVAEYFNDFLKKYHFGMCLELTKNYASTVIVQNNGKILH